MGRSSLFAMLLLASLHAHAAQWYVGSATSSQGAVASIPIWIAGDGATSDAQVDVVFDEARLRLSNGNGEIPGAAIGGGAYCVRVASNRLRVFKISGGGSPLAAGWTQVCTVPFTVAANAVAGESTLTGSSQLCAASMSSPPCTVTSGKVTVSGVPQQGAPVASEFALAALLDHPSDAPPIPALVAFDFSSDAQAPMKSLESPRPLWVRALAIPRARGDHAKYLDDHPDTVEAKLERYIVVGYRNIHEVHEAAAQLANDAAFLHVAVEGEFQEAVEFATSHSATVGKSFAAPHHLATLSVPGAWQVTGGWALVGVVDSGVDPTHPALASFVGGSYKGGNLLPAYSGNLSRPDPDLIDNDGNGYDDEYLWGGAFDELEWGPTSLDAVQHGCGLPAADPICQSATPGTPCVQASAAGHGTHVVGLIGARTDDADLIADGACRHCGIGIVKITYPACTAAYVAIQARHTFPHAAAGRALMNVGAQVVNLSGGVAPSKIDACATSPNDPRCLMLTMAAGLDVAMVAAAGNSRRDIDFPAQDRRALSVGGVDGAGGYWDESPGSNANCPGGLFDECGSNLSKTVGYRKQELVAPAKAVWSTMYRGRDWHLAIGCGDAVGASGIGDGVGLCTGTSMSAPQVAGIVGLLRSINPLLRVGDPESAVVYGVRNVLRDTTDRASLGLPWNDRLGYGIPNAHAASARILGTVHGERVINRVTPLFTLYSDGASDIANVATPQTAMALIRFQAANYDDVPTPASITTPGYATYPDGALTPRASAYVLTTEFDPRSGLPTLTPLYLLDRIRPWPAGCVGSLPSCNPHHRDFLLVASVAHVEAAVAAGYTFRGRQGYIYPTCSGAACSAPGTEALYRMCNPVNDDCATFPESQKNAYVASGYSVAFPPGSDPNMGFAYLNVDQDADSLIDGMEYVIGTNPNSTDSDGDGVSDGSEFPQSGVSFSDPCSGPNVTCSPRPLIFRHGFE